MCVISEPDWLEIKIDVYDNNKTYWKAILDNYEIDEAKEVDYPDKEFDVNSGSNDYMLIEHNKEKYGKPKKEKIKKPSYIKCYNIKKKNGGK